MTDSLEKAWYDGELENSNDTNNDTDTVDKRRKKDEREVIYGWVGCKIVQIL